MKQLGWAWGVVAIAGAIAWMGCEGDDPGDVRSYVDGAGKSCTVDLHDITGVATCDVTPASAGVTCGDTGNEAQFIVHESYDFETEVYSLGSCGGCLDRAARTTYVISDSCVSITCETDADCLYVRYTCQSGTCR